MGHFWQKKRPDQVHHRCALAVVNVVLSVSLPPSLDTHPTHHQLLFTRSSTNTYQAPNTQTAVTRRLRNSRQHGVRVRACVACLSALQPNAHTCSVTPSKRTLPHNTCCCACTTQVQGHLQNHAHLRPQTALPSVSLAGADTHALAAAHSKRYRHATCSMQRETHTCVVLCLYQPQQIDRQTHHSRIPNRLLCADEPLVYLSLPCPVL